MNLQKQPKPTSGDWEVIPTRSPGEWFVVAFPDAVEEIIVAECSHEADARLMALAPKMLKALEYWNTLIKACDDPDLWLHLREPRELTSQILKAVKGGV